MTHSFDHTSPLQDQLLGALIGLARAISGNEDLITDTTDQLVLESLTAIHPQYAKETSQLSQLLLAVSEEKKRIVPDCAVCCNPCGRTENYDVAHLHAAPEDVRALKYQVLADIQEMAANARKDELSPDIRHDVHHRIHHDEAHDVHNLAAWLYKVLFSLGIDYWTLEKWVEYAQNITKKKNTFV